jgi:hypothetical protein
MEITFTLDWASFALGVISTVVTSLVILMGIAFAQYKRQSSGGIRRGRL